MICKSVIVFSATLILFPVASHLSQIVFDIFGSLIFMHLSRLALEDVFDEVVMVDVLDSGDKAHLTLLRRPELGVTFTKLHCWTLTQYSKCVFLDADTLVSTLMFIALGTYIFKVKSFSILYAMIKLTYVTVQVNYRFLENYA